MAALKATLIGLQKELQELVKTAPAFKESGFSSFDLDDVSAKSEHQTFPVAGVMYNGCIPVSRQVPGGGNDVVPVAVHAQASTLLLTEFTVVIGIQYHYGGQDDTKPMAMALLDDIRERVNGYRKLNSRPWTFLGERPEPDASGNGIAFYTQVWQTVVPFIGISRNPA